MKKNILILCKTNLQSDPRVQKQIEALHSNYDVTCVGLKESMHIGVSEDLALFQLDDRESSIDRISHITKLVTKQYKSLYWTKNNSSVLDILKNRKFDLIICNETESLPIADFLATEKEIPIYCDLHEFYLDDRQTGSFSKAQQRYEEWILNHHISYVKHFTTVSPQIIELYWKKYNIKCTLLDNACKYYDLLPVASKENAVRIVSHGAAIPSRRLEIMIEAVSVLSDNYTLDLYLMNSNPTYRKHLVSLVSEISNVTILPAIPFEDIQSTINRYDVGLYLLYPTHLNNTYALPNKLFEFIQGRVAVVIGPTPAMVDIVTEYEIGKVSKEFSAKALTEVIKNISENDINRYKSNTNRAAKELNSENNIIEIQKIVKNIIN